MLSTFTSTSKTRDRHLASVFRLKKLKFFGLRHIHSFVYICSESLNTMLCRNNWKKTSQLYRAYINFSEECRCYTFSPVTHPLYGESAPRPLTYTSRHVLLWHHLCSIAPAAMEGRVKDCARH